MCAWSLYVFVWRTFDGGDGAEKRMTIDWDDLRCFLALARHGSLSAAARALGVTQPTVGRRLEAFEERLGTKLFGRRPSGYVLTAAGQSIRPLAERMEQDALTVERIASGRDVGLAGEVRVSASEWFASHVLGPIVAQLAARHPAIVVELVTDTRRISLARREADVAFRFARFEQQEIVQRQAARVAFGLYASDAYLAKRGVPDFDRGCEGHAVIAMSDDLASLADVPWMRAVAVNARVAVRSSSRDAQASLAAAGAGLVCLPRFVGDATAGLRLLTPPTPPPERNVWLGVHRDMRALPRVKSLVTFVVDALKRLGPRLDPAR
jgi:DNA-binding transcriptional LysR family regulator